MSRLAKLQLIGPILVAGAIASAEFAAGLLSVHPSSEWAWFVNLNFFGVFQRSHAVLAATFDIPYAQLLLIAAPILLLAFLGCAWRQRLALALASNLSLVYVLFLAYASSSFEMPVAASLGGVGYSAAMNLAFMQYAYGYGVYVFALLFVPAFLSAGASHRVYFHAMRRQ